MTFKEWLESLAGYDFNSRVSQGKNKEDWIKDVLRKRGYKVQDVSSKADMFDKIDAIVNGLPARS